MTQRDGERPLVPVHVCYNDSEAEVVIALLRSRDIEAIANSDLSHAVFPLTADGLGKVEVLVDIERVSEARSIIKDRLEEGEPLAD